MFEKEIEFQHICPGGKTETKKTKVKKLAYAILGRLLEPPFWLRKPWNIEELSFKEILNTKVKTDPATYIIFAMLAAFFISVSIIQETSKDELTQAIFFCEMDKIANISINCVANELNQRSAEKPKPEEKRPFGPVAVEKNKPQ